MTWQPSGETSRVAGDDVAIAAATYLIHAVHDEVDNAQVGPVTVLGRAGEGGPLYAAAAVRGPLRAYLATAWGAAGAMHGKRIVSYHTPEAAEAALRDVLAERTAASGARDGYQVLGTYLP
jgi:hypothetical protein